MHGHFGADAWCRAQEASALALVEHDDATGARRGEEEHFAGRLGFGFEHGSFGRDDRLALEHAESQCEQSHALPVATAHVALDECAAAERRE